MNIAQGSVVGTLMEIASACCAANHGDVASLTRLHEAAARDQVDIPWTGLSHACLHNPALQDTPCWLCATLEAAHLELPGKKQVPSKIRRRKRRRIALTALKVSAIELRQSLRELVIHPLTRRQVSQCHGRSPLPLSRA